MTRTASAFPTPIAAAGPFGPINYGGLLQPGSQTIRVTATNCRGTGSSPRSRSRTSRSSLEQSSASSSRIEVTQSVQDPTNQVPLVGAANSGGAIKRTFARVYLALEEGGPMSNLHDVSGRLMAVRSDGSHPPGPQSIESLNSIRVDRGGSLGAARVLLGASLFFELPPEWLTPGKLHLELERLEIGGEQSTLPCNGCANFSFDFPGPFGPDQVEFEPRRRCG